MTTSEIQPELPRQVTPVLGCRSSRFVFRFATLTYRLQFCVGLNCSLKE